MKSGRSAAKFIQRSLNSCLRFKSAWIAGILFACCESYAISPAAMPRYIENIRNPKLLSSYTVRDGGSIYVVFADNNDRVWVIVNYVGSTNIHLCEKTCSEKHAIQLQWNSKAENQIESFLSEWKGRDSKVAEMVKTLQWRSDVIRLASRGGVSDSDIIAIAQIHFKNGYSRVNSDLHYAVTKKTTKSYTVKIASADSSYYGFRTFEAKYGSMTACQDMNKVEGKWYRNYYCWSPFVAHRKPQ